MAIITINAEIGSKGIFIAQEIAERLGYLYFDHIIAEEIAELLRINKIDVKSFEEDKHENIIATISKYFSLDIFSKKEKNIKREEKRKKLYSRNIKDSYKHLLPYKLDAKGWIDAHIYKKMLYKVITSLAKTGDCIIVGRGGNIILKDEPNSLHLRFVASKKYRKKTLVEIKGVPENEVDKLIEKMDEKAVSYNEYYFNFNVNDPHEYSAVLNVEALGEEKIVDWIAKFAK
jgi:cytidylate kinase